MKHSGLDMEAKDNSETEDMVQMDKTIKIYESKESIQPIMKEVGQLTENLEDIAKHPPVRLVDFILPDFSWPAGKEAPNFHRMRWRHARGQRIEVKGNKSLFVTLTEKFPEIPESAAFSLEGLQVLMIEHFVVYKMLIRWLVW